MKCVIPTKIVIVRHPDKRPTGFDTVRLCAKSAILNGNAQLKTIMIRQTRRWRINRVCFNNTAQL